MKCSEEQIINKITSVIEDKKLLTKQLNDLLISKFSKEFELIEFTLKNGMKAKFALQEKNDVDANTMRSVVMNCKITDSIIIFASKSDNLQSIIISVPKGFSIDAKHIGNTICEKFDGKGGGSLEMFQIGGISSKHSLKDIIREL